VVALLPGRTQARDVGLVSLDLDSGHVTLTQFTDSATWVKTLHQCRTHNPSAIVLPQSALSTTRTHDDDDDEGAPAPAAAGASAETNMLVDGLARLCPNVPLVPVLRKYWNEQLSRLDFIRELAAPDDERLSTLAVSKSKWYALSACAALFKWLDAAQARSFPPASLRIRYEALEGTCLVDSETARNLELVNNLINKNSKQHLLGMLNKCFTPMGTRLLRANILSPLTDPVTIDDRLDAVEELVTTEERSRAIRTALEPLKALDLDKVVSRLLSPLRAPTPSTTTTTSARPPSSGQPVFPRPTPSQDPSTRIASHLSHLLSLRAFLTALPRLRAALDGADARALRAVGRALGDGGLEAVRGVVEAGVNRDGGVGGGRGGGGAMVGRHARLFAIKAERKLLLDVARETYRENESDAYQLGDALRAAFDLESFQMVQAGGGGAGGGGAFVFVVSKEEWEDKKGDLARSVTNVQTVKGKKVEFSSLELKKRNARLRSSIEEILLMSEEVLEDMFAEIRGHLGCLYKAAEVIARLDMIASCVHSSHVAVRPEWTDTLAIKAGRHPLHEQFRMSDGSFVPNDTYASDAASFQLIYGANMSGKSTLLRQIALLHVMAQIGCFVPALYASFRPISALLTRLSNDDDLAASLSTFASEMSTMSMILAGGGGGHCLVLVDELGRGTSPEEGVGIAHALAEEIIKSKAFCFFATHFKELAVTLPSRYPNVVSLHLEAEIDETQPNFSLAFHHKVRDGATPLTHYGLELAKLAKLPSRVLHTARIASLTLESLAEDGRARSREGKLARRRRALREAR
ncbi:muts domain V-domain-containing protein, partial [Rhodotorula diobovata]